MQKLQVNTFEWINNTSKFNEDFIKHYNEENDEGCILEVNIQYLEKLHELYNNLPFSPETMKIEKVVMFVANLHDKTEYVINIRNLNHRLVLQKLYRVIKFNQNTWLKLYIDKNAGLRKKSKKLFWKFFFLSWWIMQFLEKLWKMWKNIGALKFFTENLIAIAMEKAEILMNKPLYLGISILELSITIMYEFWYDYVKPKYDEKTKLCYMDRDDKNRWYL